MFVTDDAQVVDLVEAAAAAHNAKVRIAVSVIRRIEPAGH